MPAEKTELNSWKEIAERLDVSVRTAQAWEKERGLPVRRVPGGPGRVFVRVSELEAWLTGESGPDGTSTGNSERPEIRLHPWKGLAAITGGALIVLAAAVGAPWERAAVPTSWAVAGDSLVVFDESGAELWRREFSGGLNAVRYGDAQTDFAPEFVDLDRDGSWETLFVQDPRNKEDAETLICLAADGSEKWRFRTTKTIRTTKDSFDGNYTIRAVQPVPGIGENGAVVVTSLHRIYYPSRIAVLASDGTLVSEYWHAGHIGNQEQLRVADLDRDGAAEIYASGINNARERATLVVLDPATMRGAGAEQDPDYQFQGLENGVERARFFFPRSEVNRHTDLRYTIGGQLYLHERALTISVRHTLEEEGAATVLYQIGSNLKLEGISLSDRFIALHRDLVANGTAAMNLQEQEAALLRVSGG